MTTVANTLAPTPPRRVWPRYSLRTFLLFVAITSIWLAWVVNRARTQRVAVEAIQSAGGTIHFDYQQNGPRSWSTAGKPRGAQWLRNQLGSEYFDRPVYVGLFKTPNNGKWIEAFNKLPSIKTLLLSGPLVNDDTLARLDGSTALLELHLSNASITDDGLTHLAKFPNLQWLILNNTPITDAGAAHLSALSRLRELNLKGTRVSDSSVPFIIGLPELWKIDLRGTAVSDVGIARIREKSPNLAIARYLKF